MIGDDAIGEFKTTQTLLKEPPDYYIAQVHAQLYCTGRSVNYFVDTCIQENRAKIWRFRPSATYSQWMLFQLDHLNATSLFGNGLDLTLFDMCPPFGNYELIHTIPDLRKLVGEIPKFPGGEPDFDDLHIDVSKSDNTESFLASIVTKKVSATKRRNQSYEHGKKFPRTL